jgi:hypothetical protein
VIDRKEWLICAACGLGAGDDDERFSLSWIGREGDRCPDCGSIDTVGVAPVDVTS